VILKIIYYDLKKNSELSPTSNQRTPKTAMSLDMGRHFVTAQSKIMVTGLLLSA
jgi:hypothetical protein